MMSVGARGMIGKGARLPEVVEAMKKYDGVYFGAIGGAGALLSLALPAAGATVTGMMFLKGLVCALGGAVAGWFTISFVVRGQQKADEVAAAMASKTAEAAL